MRSSAVHFLILLIALCVGLQSTASATGMACAKLGSIEPATSAEMRHGDHSAAMHKHDMHMPMNMDMGMGMGDDGMTHHGHHGAVPNVTVAIDDLVCHCGAACAMASCTGSAPGMTSSGIAVVHSAALIALAIPEPVTAPRSAHGLDLIRPPSRS